MCSSGKVQFGKDYEIINVVLLIDSEWLQEIIVQLGLSNISGRVSMLNVRIQLEPIS